MTILKGLLTNHMLICAVISYFLAQLIKIILCLIREKRIDFTLMFASGGMPSSHASTVTALAISAARCYGTGSPAFAIAFILASIVMYDAAGVRRAAGEQAKVLNRLVKDFSDHNSFRPDKTLKELLGHTPLQVVIGAVLGFAVALIIPA